MPDLGISEIAALASATAAVGNTVISARKGSPTLPKPTVMPTADDEASRLAAQKSIADQLSRRGRASTILSDDTLG